MKTSVDDLILWYIQPTMNINMDPEHLKFRYYKEARCEIYDLKTFTLAHARRVRMLQGGNGTKCGLQITKSVNNN